MAKKERFFLISPFHADFTGVHEALADAASRFQYLALDRVDTQSPGQSKLFQEIRDRIRTAAFVVADISLDPRIACQNPNVMIEAGYAMGLGKEPFLISRPPIRLPSDVNQYKVFSYDPRAEDLADHLEHYLEGILLQVGIDADRAVRKRTTLPELHRWLIDVTKKLRERAKDTYVDDSGLWEVSRIVSFLPTRCTFWLRHKFDEAEKKAAPDTGQEGVAIECGAFYADWNRRESPFRISVKRLAPGAREVEVESFPVQPAEPLEVVRDDAVFAAFEQKLDELVSRLTPGLSRNAPLAKRLNVMQKALAEIRTVEAGIVPGLVPRQPQAAKWGVDGCEWEFKAAADDSLLVFAVDFRRWEQSSGEAPFWVRFQPRSTKDQPAIEEWVNRLQQKVDGIEVGQGSWTFPLFGKPEQTVKEKFCGLAGDILERYRPAAKEAEAGSQPADGVVGPVVA